MRPDEVFTALSDRTRRIILESLSTRGPCTATELASGLPITRQAVAKHLGQLARAQMVVAERHGRETRYRIVPERLQSAIDWLEALRAPLREERAA